MTCLVKATSTPIQVLLIVKVNRVNLLVSIVYRFPITGIVCPRKLVRLFAILCGCVAWNASCTSIIIFDLTSARCVLNNNLT